MSVLVRPIVGTFRIGRRFLLEAAMRFEEHHMTYCELRRRVLPATSALALAALLAAAPAYHAIGQGMQNPGQNNSTTQNNTVRQQANIPATQRQNAMPQEEVRRLQAALQRNGETIKVDGIWGPQTEQALRDYQQKNGLQTSGQLDEQTRNKLNLRRG